MAMLNKVFKGDIKKEQMIHWPILSDIIKYIDRSPDMALSLTVKPLDYRQHKRLYHSLISDKDLTEDVESEVDTLKDKYFNKYEGIYAEISQATRLDESTDLSTTYLGKTDMTVQYVYSQIQVQVNPICKSLHALPKFASSTQRVQVGNRQCVPVLFVIPIIIDVCGHIFTVLTLVSEIHDNVDLVLGMKNVFELEEVIDM